MVGIIGAMKIEVETLINEMKNKEIYTISNIKFVRGTIAEKECVVAQCGPGKVNAAICAQTMILKFSPKYVVNTGVAGALSNLLGIGDIAVGDAVIQHDVDTSALGDEKGMISGINLVKIPCSEYLVNLALESLNDTDLKFVQGAILTGDQFINDRNKLKVLQERFHGIACEMEGGSIGQVCYINGVEFIVIRSISDGADNDSAFDYEKFAKESAEKSSSLVKKMLFKMKNID